MIVNRCVPEFPSRWSEKRLKFAAQSVDKKIEGASADGEYLGLENVESWTGRLIANDQEATRESTVNQYEIGDVLFGKLRPYLAKVFEAGIAGTASTEFLVLRARQGIVNRFLAYVLRSPVFIEAINAWTYGAKMPRANWEIVGSMPFPMPSPDEQSEIADFLDRETAKADALVTKYERLIELLEEKRAALITQAVTRGLNPSVPMKDSGIEWIGEVPAHWDVAALRRFATRTVVGIAEAATHAYCNDGVPILRSTNVRPNEIEGEILHIEPAFAGARQSKSINAGDLVTVRTGEPGVTAVVPPHLDGCQCFTMLITTLLKEHVPEFFSFAMNSQYAREFFAIEGWGTAQANISVPILKSLPVAVPTPEEQLDIANYIARASHETDILVGKCRRAVSLMIEHRSALITAAVTGQIDVRTYRSQEVRELEGAIV